MKKVGHQPFPHIFHRKRKAAISKENSSSQAKIQDNGSTSKEKRKLNNTYQLRIIIEAVNE